MISVRGVATIAGIATSGAVGAAALIPLANAADQYLALAYSPSTGVVGGSRNYPTRAGAENRAMQECADHPIHPSDCKVVSSAHNKCVALALGKKVSTYSAAHAETIEEAENLALSHIAGGHIVVSHCNSNGEPEGDNEEFSANWP